MPTNKNAFIRYKYLDKLLSDKHHYYDIHDLTDKVNEMLYNDGFSEVTQRCIEKDINTLEYTPFNAPITRFVKNGKRCISYEKRSFSIFMKEMSDEETNLLIEVLDTIGQFEGLDNFKWLDDFKIGIDLKKRKQIIYFSNNPYLQNSNLLGTLFDNISNEVVINLSYHTFSDLNTRNIVLHPYLLKQYNDRWFLLGAAESDKKILSFALDRIDSIKPIPEKKYEQCTEDLAERFEDIVGVTLYEDSPLEHIIFWVSDFAKDYVYTKPIHGSQKSLKDDIDMEFRKKYPHLQGGAFFAIDCIKNYELIRELCSFGKELLVVHPLSIQEEITSRIKNMIVCYDRLKL